VGKRGKGKGHQFRDGRARDRGNKKAEVTLKKRQTQRTAQAAREEKETDKSYGIVLEAWTGAWESNGEIKEKRVCVGVFSSDEGARSGTGPTAERSAIRRNTCSGTEHGEGTGCWENTKDTAAAGKKRCKMASIEHVTKKRTLARKVTPGENATALSETAVEWHGTRIPWTWKSADVGRGPRSGPRARWGSAEWGSVLPSAILMRMLREGPITSRWNLGENRQFKAIGICAWSLPRNFPSQELISQQQRIC